MDTRQLKFFVACAKAGSISEAARKLYSTQSTVSKAIKNMEETMGIRLFDRLPRGISLTAQGQQVYRYACKIVSDMEALEAFPRKGQTRWIRISLNPSSWFADRFVQFYKETTEQNYHYQIYTAGVETVLERVRDYLDDAGFVYVFEQQQKEFSNMLAKSRLTFVTLHESELRVYPGKRNVLAAQEGDTVSLEKLKDQRFIQNYQDEYISIENSAEENVLSWRELDVAVVTNSDYIMDKMLKSSDLVNLSGSYLSEDQDANYGKRLALPHNRIRFGYVMRKEEQLDEGVWELIRYLERQLRKNPQDDDSAI